MMSFSMPEGRVLSTTTRTEERSTGKSLLLLSRQVGSISTTVPTLQNVALTPSSFQCSFRNPTATNTTS
jgi:hypothetical protein